ncbi:MAG: NUDIX domain-containing protein [Candidatus Diapherotrites archaeon]|nr:NUDIX domain-containing protein [Candidatus Diapherotrites archaeon]
MERSSGCVVFKQNKSREYLLLHYDAGHWSFPKGHIEENESAEEAMKRELFEETGIKEIRIINGFREKSKYFYYSKGKRVLKTVEYFLVEALQSEVKLSFEHQGYEWLKFEKAIQRLTFKNDKEILKKAETFLRSRLNAFVD